MHDCIIIGGGPAGLTAGIYLRRFHRDVYLVDAGKSRAELIPVSHNYPGFPEGISGSDLLLRLRAQFKAHGGAIHSGHVTELERNGDGIFVAEVGGERKLAKAAIMATGVVDIEPDIAGFQVLKAQGLIRFCPICDGFEYTDQRIGILGCDVHGIREALFISHFSHALTLVCLNETAQFEPAELAQLQHCHAGFVQGKVRRMGLSDNGVIRVEMCDGDTREFDVVYCALGTHTRSLVAAEAGGCCDDSQCLVVDDSQETNIPGLFAIGDVANRLNQLAVAVGQAAIAATAIHNRYLGQH